MFGVLETFAASDSAVHTSAMFTPCSDGLIREYERAFNFCNQLVTSCVVLTVQPKGQLLYMCSVRARVIKDGIRVYVISRVWELI